MHIFIKRYYQRKRVHYPTTYSVSITRSLLFVIITANLINYILVMAFLIPAFSISEAGSLLSAPLWTRGSNMISPRTDFTGASLNEKIYILGGFNNSGKSTDRVEYYDPKTDTWTAVSAIPERGNHAAAAVTTEYSML